MNASDVILILIDRLMSEKEKTFKLQQQLDTQNQQVQDEKLNAAD